MQHLLILPIKYGILCDFHTKNSISIFMNFQEKCQIFFHPKENTQKRKCQEALKQSKLHKNKLMGIKKYFYYRKIKTKKYLHKTDKK